MQHARRRRDDRRRGARAWRECPISASAPVRSVRADRPIITALGVTSTSPPSAKPGGGSSNTTSEPAAQDGRDLGRLAERGCGAGPQDDRALGKDRARDPRRTRNSGRHTCAARSRGRPPSSLTTSRPAPSPTRSTATGSRRARAYARAVSDASAEAPHDPAGHRGGGRHLAMLATIGVHPYDPFGGRQLVDGFALAASCDGLPRPGTAPLDPGPARAPGRERVSRSSRRRPRCSPATRRRSAEPDDPVWGGAPFPSLCWIWAWVLAGCASCSPCPGGSAAAAPDPAPWSWPPSRRRRAPAVGDLVLAVARRSFGTVTGSALRTDAPFAHASWLHRLLTICAAGLLIAAPGTVSGAPRPDPESVHGWLPAAWPVAVGGLVLYLAWPVQFRPLLIPGADPAAAGRRDRVRRLRGLGWRRGLPDAAGHRPGAGDHRRPRGDRLDDRARAPRARHDREGPRHDRRAPLRLARRPGEEGVLRADRSGGPPAPAHRRRDLDGAEGRCRHAHVRPPARGPRGRRRRRRAQGRGRRPPRRGRDRARVRASRSTASASPRPSASSWRTPRTSPPPRPRSPCARAGTAPRS